jgi:hypothetical protein
MMKLLQYILISVLMLGIALAAPARTQTTPIRLPFNLNVALCVNNWDQASSLVQQMLISPNLSSGDRSQLLALSTQIKSYQTAGVPIDQSDACAMAIAPTPSNSTRVSLLPASNCVSGNLMVNGRCLSNQTAVRRYSRSVQEGDHRDGNEG